MTPLTLIFLGGIAVRLILLLLFDPSMPAGDSIYYLAIARNIAEHGVHGTGLAAEAFRVPLYPFLIASMWTSWQTIVVTQSAITLATATYVNRAMPGPWGPLIALSPFNALMDFLVLTESLTTNLLIVLFVFCFVNRHSVAWWKMVVVGIGLGLLALLRETYLLLPLALLPALWLLFRSRHVWVALAAFLLCVSPWVVRNGGYLSKGTFWLNLWIGTWERNGDWIAEGIPPSIRVHIGDEAYFKRKAITQIKADPVGVVTTWVARSPNAWVGTRTDINKERLERGSLAWIAMKSAFWGLNTLLLLAAAIGVFLARRECWLFLVPVGYLALIYLPFHSSETRYSVAAVPFLILFAILVVRKGRAYVHRRVASFTARKHRKDQV